MRVATRWRKARSCVTKRPRAWILGEEGLQPDDRLEIEMIRRLIEEQHVGVRDQSSREQDAASPSARQRVDTGIRRKVEARQHELDALFDAPSVPLFEIVLETPELSSSAASPRARSRPFDVGRDEVAQIAEAVGHRVEDRPGRGERNILLEPGDAGPVRPHRTRVGCCSPLTIRSSVDLPAPFRPTTEMRSPRSICSVAHRTAAGGRRRARHGRERLEASLARFYPFHSVIPRRRIKSYSVR